MGRTVGIMLDHQTFKGIPRRQTGYERISLYNRSAKLLRLTPFYMSIQQTGNRQAIGYKWENNRYILQKQALPRVIHNRALTMNPVLKRKLKAITKSSTIFNRVNRFSKYQINRLLQRNEALRSYVPATFPYTQGNLAAAMKRYSSLFIKPTSGSVGIGIMKLNKTGNNQWAVHWKRGAPTRTSAAQAMAFINRQIGKQSYLIQETIPLAAYQGRPYDIRVTVQRNGSGTWQVSGMIGKVAAKGQHVTNVAKGGTVRRVEELLVASGFSSAKKMNEIRRASLQIANYVSKHLPHLADIGLDMAVTKQGRIRFIELNGRDQRYAYQTAGMHETFFRTYLTPLQYAKGLLDSRSQR